MKLNIQSIKTSNARDRKRRTKLICTYTVLVTNHTCFKPIWACEERPIDDYAKDDGPEVV